MNENLRVYIDHDKNRLVLRATGFVNPKDAEIILNQYLEALDQISKTDKEFFILMDLRGFKASSAEVQPHIVKIQETFTHCKAKKIASVVDSAITSLQFDRLGKQNEVERYLMRFNDLEMAIRWLEGKENFPQAAR